MILPCSLSSATIPDDMTMSCSSIIERFSDIEGSESEKETLLKRLTEVIESEQKQVEEDISFRQEQPFFVKTLRFTAIVSYLITNVISIFRTTSF